jgi:hypothetical protein
VLKSRYKDALQTLVNEKGIAFLADIHGADISHDFAISVGIIDKDNKKACSCPGMVPIIEDVLRSFQYPLFNLGSFTGGSRGTVTYFAKNRCGIEAAQFEINAKYRIIERKSGSSKALEGVEPHFKAHEEDVLKLINYMKGMILSINKRINREKKKDGENNKGCSSIFQLKSSHMGYQEGLNGYVVFKSKNWQSQ